MHSVCKIVTFYKCNSAYKYIKVNCKNEIEVNHWFVIYLENYFLLYIFRHLFVKFTMNG